MNFSFAGFRGYPEVRAGMRVVAGNPRGYAGQDGLFGAEKVTALAATQLTTYAGCGSAG